MIYLKSGNTHILILEPGNLVDLKAGELIHSPDKEVVIVYTKDIAFFTQEFQKVIDSNGAFSQEDFDRVHKESLNRPEKINRPYHEIVQIFKREK